MVEPIYPPGLPPKYWYAYDAPAQTNVTTLRFIAQFLDIPNADQLNRTQLLHQIVARKIDDSPVGARPCARPLENQ